MTTSGNFDMRGVRTPSHTQGLGTTAMDCQKAIEKLHTYLDRQLTADEQAEVKAHLDGCEHCGPAFRFEAGVLHLVRSHCSKTVASVELHRRVRITLQQAPLPKTP